MCDEKYERVKVHRNPVQRAKNAVAALKPRQGFTHFTLQTLVDRSIEAKVHELEVMFNGGRPFPERDGDLQPGRPKKNSEIAPISSCEDGCET